MSPIVLALALFAQAHGAEGQPGPSMCDITRASYIAAGQPDYRLSFARLRSSDGLVTDLGLHVRSASGKVDLWWFFDQGSKPRIWLISTPDPTAADWTVPPPDGGVRVTAALTFIGMMKNGAIMSSSPNSGSPPPDYVIIPEAASLFDGLGERAYTPAAFVLQGCDRP
jgi:hypothetical protein